MAWEENSRICLHMQLIAILSRTRVRSIPFAIKAKESKEDKVTDEAIEAFENMCKTARENNIEMSLDEINAEIKEVRRLRKDHK